MEKQTTVRVLGVVGSPRRSGNTEVLIDEVLRGAAEAGATVEKILLDELAIAACDACESCATDGVCYHEDDMAGVLDKMAQSQVWVLGTPVYWWGPSAQFKLFLDRWYCKQFRAQDQEMFHGRRIILVVPMGDGDPATARHLVGMMQDAIDYLKAELAATVLAPGVNDPGEVRQHADVLAAAYRAGQQAVRS